MPEMTPVESSNVHSVGYDAETLELDVRFKDKRASRRPRSIATRPFLPTRLRP